MTTLGALAQSALAGSGLRSSSCGEYTLSKTADESPCAASARPTSTGTRNSICLPHWLEIDDGDVAEKRIRELRRRSGVRHVLEFGIGRGPERGERDRT